MGRMGRLHLLLCCVVGTMAHSTVPAPVDPSAPDPGVPSAGDCLKALSSAQSEHHSAQDSLAATSIQLAREIQAHAATRKQLEDALTGPVASPAPTTAPTAPEGSGVCDEATLDSLTANSTAALREVKALATAEMASARAK